MIFLLKKLVGQFVVPPGLFVTLAAASLISLIFSKKRLSLYLGGLLLLGLYLLSIEPVKDLILKPLEGAYPYPKSFKELECSYGVVLGGGVIPHSQEEGGAPSVRAQVFKRLFGGYKLWREKGIPLVLSGGDRDAEAMASVLTYLGVSKSSLIIEDRSRTTFENAKFTSKLVGKAKVCLITSAYHMKRSVMIFKSFGFKVVPIPTDYRIYNDNYTWRSFIPRGDYLEDSMAGLREYVGILFFSLTKWRAREDSNLRPTD